MCWKFSVGVNRAEIEDVDCPINSIGNFLHYNHTVYTLLVKNGTNCDNI